MAFINKNIKTEKIEKKCEICENKFMGYGASKFCEGCKEKKKNKYLYCKKCMKKREFKELQYCNKCFHERNLEREKDYLVRAKKWNLENYPRQRLEKDFRNKNKRHFKEWYSENKKHQQEYMKEYYKENKEKWDERRFTNRYRKEIIKNINKSCVQCGKEGIKIIHHKEYGHKPKLPVGRRNNKIKSELLKEYCKYLFGFCSMDCHRSYESGLPLIKKISKEVCNEKGVQS